MFGRVTKYFHDKGFGFIRGEDGNSYFIHASKLRGKDIMYSLSHMQTIGAIITLRMLVLLKYLTQKEDKVRLQPM